MQQAEIRPGSRFRRKPPTAEAAEVAQEHLITVPPSGRVQPAISRERDSTPTVPIPPPPPGAAPSAPYTIYTLVTPELAGDFLGSMAMNRPLRERVALQYAMDMEGDAWQPNAETVKVDRDGHMFDGQHRMTACILSGKPFYTLIAYNVDPNSFVTVDSGLRRKASDFMALLGEPDATTLAGALRVVWQYETNTLHYRTLGQSATNQTVLEMFQDHEAIRESVKKYRRIYRILPPAVACGLHYIFSRHDMAAADAFFDALENGENIGPGDPVYVLRERLISIKQSHTRVERGVIIYLVIRAWNATRSGQTINRLVVPSKIEPEHVRII